MLNCILVGGVLMILTVAIHGVGTTVLVAWLRLIEHRNEFGSPGPFRGAKFIVVTAFVLFMLHTIESTLWGLTFLAIPDLPQISTVEEALYFSMVTFGSLGYGDIVMDGRWRLLAGIECMTGMLIFGWSAALLMAVVQRLWKENTRPPEA